MFYSNHIFGRALDLTSNGCEFECAEHTRFNHIELTVVVLTPLSSCRLNLVWVSYGK